MGYGKFVDSKGYTHIGKWRFGMKDQAIIPVGVKMPKKYVNKGTVLSRLNRQPTLKYSSRSYKKGEELRCVDWDHTGAYNAGIYTPDTQPFEMIPINSTGAIQSYSNLQQGTGLAQRLGNKASAKSLRIKLQLATTGNFFVDPNYCRIIVFYDRAPNGAYLAPNDFLKQNHQDNTVGAGNYADNLNVSYMDRIVILRDDLLTLPGVNNGDIQTVVGPTDQCFIYDKFIDCKSLELVYSSTSNPAVIANSSIGSVGILVMGDRAANAEPWQLKGGVRFRFFDN